MTVAENARINTQLPFPALVAGSGPVTIAKNSGIWTVGFNIAILGNNTPLLASLATDYLIFYDAIGQQFQNVSLAQLQAALALGSFSFSALVNFNAANTDTQIALQLPPGFTRYFVERVMISGANAVLTTATIGLFTAAGGAGTAIVTNSAITVNSASEDTINNMQGLTVNNQNTQSHNQLTLFARVGTAQGAPATGKVTVVITPVS